MIPTLAPDKILHQIEAVAAVFVLIALGAKRMASKNESDHRDLAVISAGR
jgi:hypothetical protein